MNTSVIKDAIMTNFAVKVVAFLITLLLFLWVRNDREATVVVHASIKTVIPEDMVLVTPPLDRVRLTVRGRSSDIARFDPNDVPPINVIAGTELDQSLTISPDSVQLPVGLEVAQVTPEFVRIGLEPLARKIVPISPRVTGEPRATYVVGPAEIQPPQIEISGPRSSVEKILSINTEQIDITDRTAAVDRRVQLRVDDPMVRFDGTNTVNVRIPIQTVEITRTFESIRVRAVNTTRQAQLSPTTLAVTLRGPRAAMDAITPSAILATVDMSQEDRLGSGTFEKQPVVKNLPSGVSLVEIQPQNLIVTTEPRPRPSDEP